MSIMLDEADAYERGMDDDLTFQTVRELAGTAYMAGRSAPPTAVEIEAVARKLLWTSRTWDGIDSDYQAKDEEDASITPAKSSACANATPHRPEICSKSHGRR